MHSWTILFDFASALIHLFNWTWSCQCCTTGEPQRLSEERCFESSVVLFILPAAAVQLLLPHSHTANMSAGGALWRMLAPAVICHFPDSLDLLLLVAPDDDPSGSSSHLDMSPGASVAFRTFWAMLISSRPRSKAPCHMTRRRSFCSTGDAPKWKLKYFLILRVLLWCLKWSLVPPRLAWTPSSCFEAPLRTCCSFQTSLARLFSRSFFPGCRRTAACDFTQAKEIW